VIGQPETAGVTVIVVTGNGLDGNADRTNSSHGQRDQLRWRQVAVEDVTSDHDEAGLTVSGDGGNAVDRIESLATEGCLLIGIAHP
jgi:hypothetical protein